VPSNPEHESQEHNKPKPNAVEGENIVFSPAEQQAAERLGKPPPPLHPIFERLSQALAKQRSAERSAKPPPRELPESPDIPKPQDPSEFEKRERRRAYKREWMRRWRKEHPEKNREAVSKWVKSERGREYRRVYMREYHRRKRNQSNSGN
jgi:hypothetical protein